MQRNAPLLATRMLPMLVAPRPWLTWNNGGYLKSSNECIRVHFNTEHLDYVKEADERGHLSTVLHALDVLGVTPWRINAAIFDVVSKIWNSGEALAGIPAAFDPPPRLSAKELEELKSKTRNLKSNSLINEKKNEDLANLCGKVEFEGNTPNTPKKGETWATEEYDKLKELWRIHRQEKVDAKNRHSQRCDTNYKVEIAKAFLNETFYLPHNLDFRGRAYPIPPHLNHLGNDLCRGLLLFNEAKPLGKSGLYWLKIHLANVWGFDKASFQKRAEWTDARWDDILDSVEHPLDVNFNLFIYFFNSTIF